MNELQSVQMTNKRRAQLIEWNLEVVEQVLEVIRSAIASAMDWRALAELVEEEKKRNNHLALRIAKLKLETNHVTLWLSEPIQEGIKNHCIFMSLMF